MSSITFSRVQLLAAIMQVDRFTGKNHPWAYIHFDIKEGCLYLTGMDETCGVCLRYEEEVDHPMISRLIPGRLFTDILNRINEDIVTLSFKGEELIIKNSSKTSKVNTIQAEDYPQMPGLDSDEYLTSEMPVADFKLGLHYLMPFASDDATKLILNGVHFGEDWFSTDGHRMSRYTNHDNVMGITLPLRSLQEIQRNLTEGNVLIKYEEHNPICLIENGNARYYSRILEGQYPNAAQLIPASFHMIAEIDRAALVQELQYVMVIASQKNDVLALHFEPGCLRITAEASSLGSAEATLPISVNNPLGRIGFNGKYLLEVLQTSKAKTVFIKGNGLVSPIVIEFGGETSFLHLIMPVQIRD